MNSGGEEKMAPKASQTAEISKTWLIFGIIVVAYIVYRLSKGQVTRIALRSHVHVSVVGFGRNAVVRVKQMLETYFSGITVSVQVLSRDDDLDLVPLQTTRVILAASFTERNNIMGIAPDYGEMSRVYDMLPKHIEADLMLIYAGVPPSAFKAGEESALFPAAYSKLPRSQPSLAPLMNSSRFMAITNQYRPNSAQCNELRYWLNKYA